MPAQDIRIHGQCSIVVYHPDNDDVDVFAGENSSIGLYAGPEGHRRGVDSLSLTPQERLNVGVALMHQQMVDLFAFSTLMANGIISAAVARNDAERRNAAEAASRAAGAFLQQMGPVTDAMCLYYDGCDIEELAEKMRERCEAFLGIDFSPNFIAQKVTEDDIPVIIAR